jgi:hypothetical protein
MFELFAVHIERFGSQHLLTRTVDRVHVNVANNVGLPTFQKRRTAIALIPHRKYDYVTIENTGFVSSMQRRITTIVLKNQIQKLFVSRKFYGSPFAN